MEKFINSQADIDGIKWGNSYHAERVKNEFNKLDEIANFHPCKLRIETTEHEGKIYLENTALLLAPDIAISKQDYHGQYFIYLDRKWRRGNLNNLDYNDEAKALANLEAPQNFKVLNAKRIKAWVDYCNTAKNILLFTADRIANKQKEYMERVEAVAKKNGWELKKNHNGTSYIDNGLFEFRFSFQGDYISESIEFRGYEVTDKLTTFEKLSKI